jgi:putative integral membrane protein (TIGR02587 family)
MTQTRRGGWRLELQETTRGLAGAFLFGLPFLYTMEVWWSGNSPSPEHLATALVVTFGALVVLVRSADFRWKQSRTLGGTLAAAVKALALGLAAAAAGLVLLRRLRWGLGWDAALGRVVMEGMPFSVGVGVANHTIHHESQGEGSAEPNVPPASRIAGHLWGGTLADIGATALGAMILAFPLAAVEEIPMIAASLTPPRLLGLVAASLALTYVVVFHTDIAFGRESHRPSIFHRPMVDAALSYVIALAMSAGMLAIFGNAVGESWPHWGAAVLVLGLPAAAGGAAGRLIF